MLRDAWAVLVKDLRIEVRTRVGLWQVLPFAVIALLLFSFALGPKAQTLGDEFIHLGMRSQRMNAITLRMTRNHIQRRYADGSGCA